MNKAIKNVWMVSIILFALLFASITYIQVFFEPPAEIAGYNTRELYKAYGSDRGAIIVDGEQIVYSKETPNKDSEFKYQRVYEKTNLYSPITGYYTFNYGSTGLESEENDNLSGNGGQMAANNIFRNISGQEEKGASVELTIKNNLQQIAHDRLGDMDGAVVVTQPKTGRILALYSTKSFDPNSLALHDQKKVGKNIENYRKDGYDPIPLSNSAATGKLYAPGSVFKIIDTAAALESDKYDANSILPNPPKIQYPGYELPNFVEGNCGAQTEASFAFALEQSCNTPFAGIATNLGEEKIAQTAQNFGFNSKEPLNVPLPVTKSNFPRNLADSQLGQSAIGQFDVKATPLEINMMTAAIANGGKQMKPNLVEKIRTPELQVLDSFHEEELRQSTTPEIANQIRDWMVSTVDVGIAGKAKVPNVSVAGKTGTAELEGNQVYNSWFTGFAPADDPEVAVTAVVSRVGQLQGAEITQSTSKQLIEAVLNQE